MARTIHIETYGCQMNDYESDRTFRLFHDQHGYEWTDEPAAADLVLYNTCSIREKADHKAYSSIGKLRSAKLLNPDMIIAVGGCLAQSEHDQILKRAPFVDLVFGTHQWTNLPELVDRARIERTAAVEVEFYGWRNYSFLPYRASKRSHPVSELVTIQNGCDKFCSFCLVPFTRGREVSRPPAEILDEIRQLADQGVREVTLLGQNVNAYGRDRSGEVSFARLLQNVADVNGVERIRFVTSHPAELSFDLMDAMADNKKICKHLHLPVQSGSDRLLKKMSRGYTPEEYLSKCRYLLSKMPGLALTTDIIVGFPSETDDEFEQTMNLVRELEFDDSYSFKFSARPHTKAAQWTDEFVPEELQNERLYRLQELQQSISEKRLKSCIGKTVEVLVEGEARNKDGYLCGKTSTNRTVNFSGEESSIGSCVQVEITDANSHTLKGMQCSSR